MNIVTDGFNKIRRKFKYNLDYTGERVVPTEMHGDPRTWIQHLSRYVFALNHVVRCETLDMACGTGYGSAILSSLAKNLVGLDISKQAVLWAKKNNTFYCPATFIVRDIEKQTVSKMFDSIVCFETIEHLKNPQVFLQKMSTYNIKKNGKLIFSVPLEDPPNRFHKHRFNWDLIEKLITRVLGNETIWYSQTDQIISLGKIKNAKFAIGVWVKK